MNIRNNIVNYLFDKDYCVCTYDNYVYIYKYNALENFSDNRITLKVNNRVITVIGIDLTIVKITKDEILVRGEIKNIEMSKV